MMENSTGQATHVIEEFSESNGERLTNSVESTDHILGLINACAALDSSQTHKHAHTLRHIISADICFLSSLNQGVTSVVTALPK